MELPNGWDGEKLLQTNLLFVVRLWSHSTRVARAKVVALGTSLLLHGLLIFVMGVHWPSHISSTGIASLASATEHLKVRLIPTEAVIQSVETTLIDPEPSGQQTLRVTEDHSAESTASAKATAPTGDPSQPFEGSNNATQGIGTLIDLGTGKELDPSYWIRSRAISPPLTVVVSINPSGFIDRWEVTPNFDLSQFPDASFEKLVWKIPVTKTGETHVLVYEFVLGTYDALTIANLYSSGR